MGFIKKKSRVEKNLKKSFSKVKEDLNSLKTDLNTQKELILKVLERLDTPREIALSIPASTYSPIKIPQEIRGSKQASKQSLSNHSNNPKITHFNKDLEELFFNLPKKQFLTFLVLYHLTEEYDQVTYENIATQMNLSEACIRGYISSLMKKGAPILKEKINNRVVHLSILKDFRDLNLKQKLESMYYKKDPNQRRLIDKY